MTRHPLTGQVARALRSVCLTTLCLLFLPLGLAAQNAGSPAATVSNEAEETEGDGSAAANPTPEPDTWMLLGTGAVVLLLLYTRRRSARVLTPHTAQQQS
jgi:hypothetical protein